MRAMMANEDATQLFNGFDSMTAPNQLRRCNEPTTTTTAQLRQSFANFHENL